MKKNLIKLLLSSCLIIIYSKTSNAQWVSLHLTTEQNLVQSFVATKDKLYMGINSAGIFSSKDEGLSWQLNNEGIAMNEKVYFPSMVACGGKIYTVTNNAFASRIYESSYQGNRWDLTVNGLGDVSGNNFIYRLFAVGGNVYASSPTSLYVKANESSKWIKTSFPVQNINREVIALIKKGNMLFASTTQDGLYSSSDNGETWKQLGNKGLGIDNRRLTSVNHLGVNHNYLLAGTEHGLFVSYDEGENWKLIKQGVIRSLLINDSKIYVGQLDNKTFYSGNDGATWEDRSMGLGLIPTALAISNQGLYAVNNGYGIFKQNDIRHSVENSTLLSDELQVNIYPTIVTTSCSVVFDLQDETMVELTVSDVLGRKVFPGDVQLLSDGNQEIAIHTESLNNGTYFIHLKIGEAVITKKIIVNK